MQAMPVSITLKPLNFSFPAHRNLSQLPNFALSVPLAYFLLEPTGRPLEQEVTSAREEASKLIQQALTSSSGGE